MTTLRYLFRNNHNWRIGRTFATSAIRCIQRQPPTPPLAFVFDIDGVLVRGTQVIPAAKRALAILEGDNPMGSKIPYILMTNGGGVGEEERCRTLTKELGFPIKPEQYIQAHTILKTLAHKYANVPVLVLGGKLDAVRRVAESYGFKNAYTTLDVHAWNSAIWPFHELSSGERLATKAADFSKLPISAILVFHDPRNWSLDIQVICDVIQSGGIIGGPYVPVHEQITTNPVELVFCNADLLWRSGHSRPRLGQGAFKEAFQAVYKALTGSTYPYIQYGKPTEAAYRFAAQVLADCFPHEQGPGRLPQVYMVGDNPESDIAGANAANWMSILVHTGVYDPMQGPPAHRPTWQARDVEEAVNWAIEREMERAM